MWRPPDFCKWLFAAVLLTGHLLAGAQTDLTLAPGFTVISPRVGGTEDDLAPPPQPSRVRDGMTAGSIIALGDGRLMLAYMPRIGEGGEHFRVAVSDDGGRTWLDDREVERNPTPDIQHLRPLLLRQGDGTIWLFYTGWMAFTNDPETSRCDIWAVRSTDGGETWSGRRRLTEGRYTGLLQSAIETSEGSMVIAFCYLAERGRFVTAALVSTDGGATWRESAPIDIGAEADLGPRSGYNLNGGALEPSVVELADGRLLMMMRTLTGFLHESISSDGGLTWTAPVRGKIDCGGTKYLTRLQGGDLALVWNRANHDATGRHGWPWGYDSIWIALSSDDGESWSEPVCFAKGARVVHSLVLETAPGELLLTMPERTILLTAPLDMIADNEKPPP